MKFNLVKTKNPRKVPETLRNKSKEISDLDLKVLNLIKNMIKIMNKNKGIGLSAIQVGVPKRIMVVKIEDDDYVFINPKITKKSRKECVFQEGCLSFPEYFAKIKRPEKVKIKAKDLRMKDLEIEADGIIARAFQHEIDHMDGKVFVDYVEDLDKLEKIKSKNKK